MSRQTPYSPESKRVRKRLSREQQFPRVGGWAIAPWIGGKCVATTLNIEEDQITVKILDSAVHPSRWQTRIFRKDVLRPPTYLCADTLSKLVGSLKVTGTLRSGMIEQALFAVDRAHYCPKKPYWDAAINLGHGSCISTPHMHVWTLELCRDLFASATNILDVGAGSGHLTALFAYLAPQANVVGLEYEFPLVEKAREAIRHQEHLPLDTRRRIHFIQGTGEEGYCPLGPYDIINVGYMCSSLPQKLVEQLKPGGKMIVPIGSAISFYDERLLSGDFCLVEKMANNQVEAHTLFWCSFVPSRIRSNQTH